jgi:hypothetical protein
MELYPRISTEYKNDFKKAFLWTAIPIGVVSCFRGWGWGLGGFGILIAVISGLILLGSKRKEESWLRAAGAGVLAGAGIGVVVMGLSCFVWSALGYKP